MRTTLLILACLALLCAAAPAQEGHWEGTLSVNNKDIGLTLDLAKSPQGQWTGSVGVPAQNVAGIRMAGLEASDKSVKFKVNEFPNQPTFDLKLAENKLSGTIGGPEGSLPIEFKRTGEAKVEMALPSPAVSKELEGDWEGTLQIPNGDLQLVVHFKNQPDKTVLATLDSVNQNAKDLGLDDVKQDGQKVEFALKRFRGQFKGTLNKDATQIEGNWSQGDNSLPLTLKKKS